MNKKVLYKHINSWIPAYWVPVYNWIPDYDIRGLAGIRDCDRHGLSFSPNGGSGLSTVPFAHIANLIYTLVEIINRSPCDSAVRRP